jgi:hypothetical protein
MHASLPEETPRVFSSNPARHPKRSPIGAYDPKILCSECDGNLGKLGHVVIYGILKACKA